jgi:hypothetical protein
LFKRRRSPRPSVQKLSSVSICSGVNINYISLLLPLHQIDFIELCSFIHQKTVNMRCAVIISLAALAVAAPLSQSLDARQDDVASILAALQTESPEDAAAAQGAL